MLWKCASVGLLVGVTVQPVLGAFPKIRLDPISTGEIVAPVGIANAGDGSGRLFVVDQRGKIHISQSQMTLAEPLIDLGSKLVPERPGFDERGLLGLAFHPNFGQAGLVGEDKFYVYYSAPKSGGTTANPINHQSVVAEYSVTGPGANTADINSERVLLTFDQPQFNHDAGSINFGPDNLLYIATGDGGGSDDNDAGHTGGNATKPDGGLGNSQDLTNLLGKVLRVDPQGSNGPGGQYGIPGDNPFAGAGGGVREEIFAYGLRNPWRTAFDDGPGGTGRFFVADVGQGLVEEVNLVERGDNLGWRIREGDRAFDDTVTPSPPATLVEPIAVYAHPDASIGLPEIGLSVTGGVVYRGSDFPELEGKYLFGDWSNAFSTPNGTLLGLEETTPGVFDLAVLEVEGGNPIGQFIQAFGLDERGEAYVATKGTLAASALDPASGLPTGGIYRIAVVPEPASAAVAIAGLLLCALGFKLRTRRQIHGLPPC